MGIAAAKAVCHALEDFFSKGCSCIGGHKRHISMPPEVVVVVPVDGDAGNEVLEL